MTQRSRRSGRRSRTPPGRGDDKMIQAQAARPAPTERQPLAQMTAAERAAWYTGQRAELEDFCSYAQEWRKGRERRRIHTFNDDRYDQFFTQAADLLRGLEELRQEAAAQAVQDQEEGKNEQP